MSDNRILGTAEARGIEGEAPYIELNVDALVGQHACIMAMSGGGKSGLIRKIVEAAHGGVQTIVLDPEDEFYTLREAFSDYLIAGGEGGDCPANVANAGALATMLLETGMNAVIQLNDLHASEQEQFVAAFITAMMEAPRALWHPALVVIDEAHRFAPQEGWAASGEAVRELTSRGRKRGFTAILATQRMAKINKNVTGDVTHWFIGRVGQATDRKVAADQLGFSPSSSDAKELQTMTPRHFYAFGPAVAVPTRMFRVADTLTTIVKAGQARLPTPPAPEEMREMLAAMAAAAAPPPEKPPERPDSAPSSGGDWSDWAIDRNEHARLLEAERVAGDDKAFLRFQEGIASGALDIIRKVRALLDPLESEELDRQTRAIDRLIPLNPKPINTDLVQREPGFVEKAMAGVAERIVRQAVADVKSAPRPSPSALNGKMKKATLDIIATYEKVWPRILPWMAAAKLAGVGLKSSQFKLYEPEAVASGQLERIGDGYRARRGAPGGAKEMLDAYALQLSPAFRKIFWAIANGGPEGRTREDILFISEVSPTSSTTSAALRQMQDDLFVEQAGDRYRLTEAFR